MITVSVVAELHIEGRPARLLSTAIGMQRESLDFVLLSVRKQLDNGLLSEIKFTGTADEPSQLAITININKQSSLLSSDKEPK